MQKGFIGLLVILVFFCGLGGGSLATMVNWEDDYCMHCGACLLDACDQRSCQNCYPYSAEFEVDLMVQMMAGEGGAAGASAPQNELNADDNDLVVTVSAEDDNDRAAINAECGAMRDPVQREDVQQGDSKPKRRLAAICSQPDLHSNAMLNFPPFGMALIGWVFGRE